MRDGTDSARKAPAELQWLSTSVVLDTIAQRAFDYF